ncbi:MAG: gliding motility-associated C-terminal domain-containing protein [Janthinobacterium lividum]
MTLTNTTSAATTTTYTLTVTSAASCTSTGTVDVTVNPIPVAVPGANVAICSGASATLGGPAVAGLTYSWSPATGLSSATAANPTVTLTNTTGTATTTTYTLTVTSAASCTSTGTVTATVNPLPDAAPGAAITICSGNTGLLGAPAVTGLTYSWSPTAGLSSPTSANPMVTLTNTTSAATTTTYILTVTNTATSCTSTGTVVVTVNPAVQPGSIGADQTVCPLSTPAAFTELTPASGGTGSYTYQWESSTDNITWTPISGVTSATYTATTPTVTTYYRRRVSSGDCTTVIGNAVSIQLQPVLVSGVTLSAPPTQCVGSAVTFTPVPTNAGSNPTYVWFVNGVQVATMPAFTSSTLADGDQVSVVLTPTVNFCASGPATASTTVHLITVPLPTVTMSVKTTLPTCTGEAITFSLDTSTNTGTNPTYQWQIDGQNVAGATGTTFTTTALHDGQKVTLTLTATTDCGPRAVISAPVIVNVYPVVDVDAGPDVTIMEGDDVTLIGTASGTYPVTWGPALGLSSTTILQPVASPTVTTTYTLSAGLGHCTDQSSVTVTVTPRLRIPTAFSPNGDGNDDTWQIENLEGYTNNHVTIFNRWGNKIFETTNYARGNEWTGAMNGQPAPIGTYYYIITLPSGKHYTGPLTVIY